MRSFLAPDQNGQEFAVRSASSTAFHELLLASSNPIADASPSPAEPVAGQPLQALEPPASPAPVTQQRDQPLGPEPLSSSTSTAPTATISANTVAAIMVGATVAGSTPQVLGYNLGHFRDGSNAADWWRYSGVKAARVFLGPSDIEPTDDIPELGDGVSNIDEFESRRAALRANADQDDTYVNWGAFEAAYQKLDSGNNKFAPAFAFKELRDQGVSILANITASPSRLPLANSEDWANAWELWQHYYAQAFLLGRDYGIERYGMFNEPNNWTWPAETKDPVGNWLRRLQLASDAIQSALADVNSRYGRSLQPQIFAPNTANGATKYNNTASGDTWGRQAVLANHTRWDASTDQNWSNFQVYNYQKYDTQAADYVSDYQALRTSLNADGAMAMPLALTEFNVRTGANYDARTETLDSPSDYAALGANCIALSAEGASQLYLFKFAQTERSGGTYPVAKNGTHYVQNGSGTLNNYGGATKAAETYRLFVKGSGTGRERLALTSAAGGAVWCQVTREGNDGRIWAFVTNTGTAPVDLELDLSALGLAAGSLAVVEEVSGAFSGGVSRLVALQGGKLPAATLPAQANWLVSLTPARSLIRSGASDDTQLADGAGQAQANGNATGLVVRSDGTVDGRRVTLLKFPVQALSVDLERVLLSLNASTLSSSGAVQAHVYGVGSDSWSEASATWASQGSILKSGVPVGNLIANNVVANQGTNTTILGQLVVTGPTTKRYQLDVTDFVRAQSDGWATFLVVQDHRWDVALPSQTSGDTQADGIRIASRDAGAGHGPELLLLQRDAPSPPPASLDGVSVSGAEVTLAFSTVLMAPTLSTSAFQVQSVGSTGSPTTLTINRVAVDPANPANLLLTLSAAPAAGVNLRVSCNAPPPGSNWAGFSNVLATQFHATSSVTSLGSAYRQLRLDGGAAINGTGNASANLICGNEAANLLSGGGGDDELRAGGGNDTLEGGAGADRLTGGLGGDRFRLILADSLLSGYDRIQDLVIGTDSLDGPTAVSAKNLRELGTAASLMESDLQLVLTSSAFPKSGAATFTVVESPGVIRTFLALNNGVAGFRAQDDAIVELTGYGGSLTNLAVI